MNKLLHGSFMKETVTCSQSDVDVIMRRLRGETPSPPRNVCPLPTGEEDQLKQIVKTLGSKLKIAYQEIAEKDAIIAEHRAQTAKNDELSTELSRARNELMQLHATAKEAKERTEHLEREISGYTQASPNIDHIQEELTCLQQAQVRLSQEKKDLEQQLEQERLKNRTDSSSNNMQLVRLALRCKELEEEIHTLTCERSATTRQFLSTKELVASLEKQLEEARSHASSQETVVTELQAAVPELQRSIEQHKTSIDLLQQSLASKEETSAALRSQLSITEDMLTKSKQQEEAFSCQLISCREEISSLTTALEATSTSLCTQEKIAVEAVREREEALVRAKEVDDHLINRLQDITRLEDALGEATIRIDELEKALTSSEAQKAAVEERLLQTTEQLQHAQEMTTTLEEKYAALKTENLNLQQQSEALQRLKDKAKTAASHAVTICQIFDLLPQTPQTYTPAPFEDRFEQHELF